mgnify:CR=1 FL=1
MARPANWLTPPYLAAAAGLIAFVSVPGAINPDSADQLAEARAGDVSDWHSAWLTHIWRLMLRCVDSEWTMLALQLLLFWGGAAVLAAAFWRAGRRGSAWTVFAVALFPHFVFFNHYILKDTAFYSAMFLCSALCFAAISEGHARRWLFAVAAALAMLATLPIRINGAFALAGLIVPLLWPSRRWRLVPIALAIAFASLLLVNSARWFNASVLQARSSDVIQSLQILDLMGIQYHSRDASVWGPYALANEEVDKCYSSFHWDTMSPTGVCASLRLRLGSPDGRVFEPEAIRKRGDLWVSAIKAHPLAYLQHRLRHMNSATFFFVPAFHARFSKAVRDGSREGRAPVTAHDIRTDYLKKNVFVWPVVWLAGGLGMLALLWPRAGESVEAKFGVALLTSALSYGFAYLVIGVATDVRYFLWVNLATVLAAVVAWRDLCDAWRADPFRRRLALAGLGAVVAAGFGARLVDVPFV